MPDRPPPAGPVALPRKQIDPRRVHLGRTALVRAVLLGVLWWVLTGGAADGWKFGVGVVALATTCSLTLAPAPHRAWSVAGLARFAWVFLWGSFRGGLDVAFRALDPRLPLQPAVMDYELRLPVGPASVWFAVTLSLLPGTLAVHVHGTSLQIHALVPDPTVIHELRTLEAATASLFGLDLSGPRSPESRNG